MGDATIPNLLVVLGATGNQGSAVLKHFANTSSTHSYKLRGISRNPNSEASQELAGLGVEIVQGELNDLSSLKKAFSDATHIFANTDSNALIFNAISQPNLLSEGRTPLSYAHDLELAYGKNIADAAASTPTLQRLVWSGIPSPKKCSGGKYTKASMWDVKEEISEVLYAKPELKGKVSTILVGIYATMPVKLPMLYAPQKQSNGSYEMALHMTGDKKIPLADLDTDLGPWISALFESPPGTTLVGATENLTWKEWLAKWATHNNVRASFRRYSDEEVQAKVPGLGDSLLEIARFLEEYDWTGTDRGTVYPWDLRRRGVDVPVGSIDEQIAGSDWSSIL
ncbi:hypothetical protein M409DRAFT_64060 [Zasmidium cellare ATCC 36951]|uniref:NmrA-like domain-containing protein n=1 Tax=Zasmidium cellare ATCC 36951 TaxID=1080233 RepID=A0A6A6CYZ0_ZASCE|nr:uncharacterized protein M409DRAFT_64060 [Zasmidium cellare ATCC 36951]KAF2171102.1 hypothetical protein M409DRAFT_64060 [Zasmidium cellare ATCC 36951]